MPDLIRHPFVNKTGPRIESGVTAGDGPRIGSGVTEREIKPGVTKEGGMREMSGMEHAHMRATPNDMARGFRAAASKQVSRQS
jgi:hypothetical protein